MEIAITDAELVLMRLLWKDHPLNAREITRRLEAETSWHRKTVNTLLSRLEKKEALGVERRDGGIKYYRPLVDEKSYTRSATLHFVDRLFGGEIAPLLARFAEDRPLNARQRAELQKLLKELSDD